MGNLDSIASTIQKKPSKDPRVSFPEHMMDILNDERNHKAIWWCKGGGAFAFVDKGKFMAEVVPRSLPRVSQFPSIVSALKNFGFSHVGFIYSHPYFHRDRPQDLKRMRSKKEGTSRLVKQKRRDME
jgi:hypothetical protein